jgi:hypothetical protein
VRAPWRALPDPTTKTWTVAEAPDNELTAVAACRRAQSPVCCPAPPSCLAIRVNLEMQKAAAFKHTLAGVLYRHCPSTRPPTAPLCDARPQCTHRCQPTSDDASAEHCSLAVRDHLAIPNRSLFAPCSFVRFSPAALGQLQQVRTALPSLNFGNAAGAHCAESHRRNNSTALHSICPRALLHIINIARDLACASAISLHFLLGRALHLWCCCRRLLSGSAIFHRGPADVTSAAGLAGRSHAPLSRPISQGPVYCTRGLPRASSLRANCC